ncbi:MAG TPA: hypothetical protein VKE22_27670, partial [Haliangiales bacterium]|nr:hypothetical protein [Haliangiales bacterium]
MKLKVLYHDNCFDGAASAATFASFYREAIDPGVDVRYAGVQHKMGNPFPADAFDGDVNACVDFRFSPSPRLDWWFDHHVSAFQPPEDREVFLRDTSGKKFYDPTARSCTKFMIGILAERFGWTAPRFAELVAWADVIDGAQFSDARTAVALEAPALRIMTWLEQEQDPALRVRLIRDFQDKPLAEVAASPYIADALAPILERHRDTIELIRRRAAQSNGVVSFDLLDTGVEAPNKFIAYMLYPDCRYTVGLTRSPARVKVSVGSNPWATKPRTHNIAEICQRYGGGGHPVVGAVSLPPGQEERARTIAR